GAEIHRDPPGRGERRGAGGCVRAAVAGAGGGAGRARGTPMRRKLGMGLLYAAGGLVIAGSMYDLFVPAVPANLLAYQGVTPATIDPRVAALVLGLLRALGGCLLAIGATALVLVHGPVRRGERWALPALVLLVGVSGGANASLMVGFGSPFSAPLTFVGVMLVGVGLVWSAGRPVRR